MPTTVTIADLEDFRACSEQCELFARTFPDGITITLENAATVAKTMVDAGFDVEWFAEWILSPDERIIYGRTIREFTETYNADMARVYADWAAKNRASDNSADQIRAQEALEQAKDAVIADWNIAVANVLCDILATR